LRLKMGNYRTKLSGTGIKDLAVNSGKCSRTNPEGAACRANIKDPKEGKSTYLRITLKDRLRAHWRHRDSRWWSSLRRHQWRET